MWIPLNMRNTVKVMVTASQIEALHSIHSRIVQRVAGSQPILCHRCAHLIQILGKKHPES